ncbi:MAG: ABC transporter permease subunit, partial [Candidatus Kariarchaeaceae archaeon]
MHIMRETLRSEKGMIKGFGIGIFLYSILMILMYPGEGFKNYIEAMEDNQMMKAFLQLDVEYESVFRFYIAMYIFAFLYIILVVLSGLSGTAIITRDLEDNTLDLLMSNPLTRRRIFTEKWLAMALTALAFDIIGFFTVWLIPLALGYEIPLLFNLAAWVQLLPLQLAIGSIGSFLAVFTKDLGKARQFFSIFIGSSYVVSMVASVSTLFADTVGRLSIFQYYDGMATFMMISTKDIEWQNSVILLIITLVFFSISLYWVSYRDLIPHYSKENEKETIEKRAKKKGIPKLFFFTSGLKNRFPCMIEQLQADKKGVNIYAWMLGIMGLLMPLIYIGDLEMEKITDAYAGNVMIEAFMQGNELVATYRGFIVMEVIASFWMMLSVFIIIKGANVLIRDIKANTSDLLYAHPISKRRIIIERMMAVALELAVILAVYLISMLVGQFITGRGLDMTLILIVVFFIIF